MLVSKLTFGSFLTYCPRKDATDNDEEIKKSRNLMYNLKTERFLEDSSKFMSEVVAERIKNELNDLPFRDFFGEHVWLVPIPKSSLMRSDSLWVPDKLARALSARGLGIHMPCLQRVIAVQKSASANSNDRPKAIDHFNSLKIKPSVHQPTEIILIDDVVTRGATMLACASLLKKYFPKAEIKGFAVIRTISKPEEFNAIKEPFVGEITLSGENTFRRP